MGQRLPQRPWEACVYLTFLARSTSKRRPFQSRPSKWRIACRHCSGVKHASLSDSMKMLTSQMLTHPVHIIVVLHDQKTEASGFATAWISHNARLFHRPILLKLLLQILHRDKTASALRAPQAKLVSTRGVPHPFIDDKVETRSKYVQASCGCWSP